MSHPPEIRWAVEADLEWAAEVDGRHDPETLHTRLKRRDIVVALLGGERAGYARVDWLWGHVPFVGWITVLEAHRGSGVGTALMLWLRDRLAERLPQEPFLWSSTEPSNTGSQRWHLSIGFEESGFLAGINPGTEPDTRSGEIFYRLPLHGADDDGGAEVRT